MPAIPAVPNNMHQSFKSIWARPEWRVAMGVDDVFKISINCGQFIADGVVGRLGEAVDHVNLGNDIHIYTK